MSSKIIAGPCRAEVAQGHHCSELRRIIKKNTLICLLVLFCALATCQRAVFAARREVIFPLTDAALVLNPFAHAFAFDGRVGFAHLLKEPDLSPLVVSYSIIEARFVDHVDLGEDFRPGFVAINAHNATGLVVIHGLTTRRSEKVVALASDSAGGLSRKWSTEVGSNDGLLSIKRTAINTDGSRIYALVGDPQVSLVLLRSEDGLEIKRIELEGVEGSLLFDSVRNRVIVETNTALYLFAPGDELQIQEVIPQAGRGSVAVSKDGRFLISYGGYILPENGATGSNEFVSHDLDLKTVNVLELRSKFAPNVDSFRFHSSSGTFLVPYSWRIKPKPRGFFQSIPGRSRVLDILTLGPDGLQPGTTTVELPDTSPGASKPNRILPWNHAAFSATGALGFVSSDNGRLFAFDTLTGEIVNEETVDPEFLAFIHVFDPPGLLVAPAGGRIILFDISTGPVISGVRVRRGRTIITGANFLSGARVSLNGEDLGVADRSPENPGRELTIRRGKKNLPTGQALTLTVVNRDGIRSNPFSFSVD